MVYTFFAEECEADPSSLSDDTRIIEELGGDSLMLLSLLELVRKQHGLSIDLRTLGAHLMKKPAHTIGEVVRLTIAIVRYGDSILDIEL